VRPPEADAATSSAEPDGPAERPTPEASELHREEPGILPEEGRAGGEHNEDAAPVGSDREPASGESPDSREGEAPREGDGGHGSSEASGESSFGSLERKAPDADLEAVDRELELVAADLVEGGVGTPLPDPVEGRSGEADPETGPRSDRLDSDRDDAPPPASKLAAEAFAEWERELTGELAERRYDVRFEDDVRRGLRVGEVAELLKRGARTGAVEIRDDGEWVSLRDHPLFDTLRTHLIDESRRAALGEGGAVEDEQSREGVGQTEATESEDPAERTGTSRRAFGRTVLASVVVLALAALVLAALGYLESDVEEEVSSRGGAPGGREARGLPAQKSSEEREAGEGRASARRAVRAARERVQSAPALERRAREHLRREEYGPARRLAVEAMGRRGVRRELRTLFERAIRRDDSLRPPTETLGVDVEIDEIHALGGGWSVSFRMVGEGERQFAFKPAQKHWERGWRAEIASYHFCEIVPCHFDIPRNRPARISRERFMTLYGRIDNEDQRAYREKFDRLEWVEEKGPDGETREYLYGTLKYWVPEFVKWPIEYQNVWESWLGGEQPRSRLERPLEEALKPLRNRGSVDFYDNILSQRGDATTRTMARGLSCILTFDYLTTNWDRFSTAEKFYGVNNQFADGRFVSIDNGAAFSRHRFDSVERRLLPVVRFSESMVTAIRALRPEVVDPILFPDANAEERSRLEVFWEQRDRFLDRLNRLVARHGESRVLVFE